MFFNIQRWSLHDGPGIRTTLFFSGCPLRCRWCCNPESWAPKSKIGEEIEEKAGKKLAKAVSEEAALEALVRDAVFYRASGGGITFSGGEPFMHPEALARMAHAAGMAGLDIAVETSGYFNLEAASYALTLMDHLFMDIKCMDEARHKDLTAVSNQRILSNIKEIDKTGKAMVIRLPLVRGLNDGMADMEAAVRFCRDLDHLKGVELMPYHPMGEGKYRALNLPYDDAMAPPDQARLERIQALFLEAGLAAECAAPFVSERVPVDRG